MLGNAMIDKLFDPPLYRRRNTGIQCRQFREQAHHRANQMTATHQMRDLYAVPVHGNRLTGKVERKGCIL